MWNITNKSNQYTLKIYLQAFHKRMNQKRMNSPSNESLKSSSSQIGLDIDTDIIDNNQHFTRRQPCVGSWYPSFPNSPQFMPLNFREDAPTPIRNILNNQFDELEFYSDDILRAIIDQCERIILSREQNSVHNKKLSELKTNTLFNSINNIKYVPIPPYKGSNSSLSSISISDKKSYNNESNKIISDQDIKKKNGQYEDKFKVPLGRPLTRTISFQSDEDNNADKEFYIGKIVNLEEMKAEIHLNEYKEYYCYFPNGFKYYGEKDDKVRVSLRFINHTDKKIALNFINKVYEKDTILEGIYRNKMDKQNHSISFIEIKGVKHASFPKNFIHELEDGDKISCKIYDIFDFKERETNKITGIGLTLSFIQKISN